MTERWQQRSIEVGALGVLVIAALVANGYHVGLGDHFIHLPFLARAMDSSFLPGDLIVEAGEHHKSLFWILQVPIVRTFGLEPSYFAIHLASLVAMLAGVMSLARAATSAEHARLVGWIGCIAAVLAPNVFGGIRSMDNHVLNRTVVMGGELFALAFALRGRGFAAMLLCGVLINIHATTAVHTAAFAGCILLVQPDRWRQIARGAVAILLGASPLIIMTLAGGAASAVKLDYADWYAAVELHWPFHHFIHWMDFRIFASLFIALIALIAAWRRTGNLVWAMMVAAMLVLVVGNYVATEVLELRIGTVLHLYEAGRVLTYLSFVAAPVAVVATRADRLHVHVAAWALVVAVILHALLSVLSLVWQDALSVTVAVIAGVVLCIPWPARDRAPRRLPPAWSALVLVVVLGLVAHHMRGADAGFGYHVGDLERDEKWTRFDYSPLDSQLPIEAIQGTALVAWARTSLPVDAVVATPPFFLHPLGGFRFRTGRSLFVTHKDGGEATFDDGFAKVWWDRMTAVLGSIPPAGEKERDGFFRRWREMHHRYNEGDEVRFRALRTSFGVTHVLCPRNVKCGSLAFPVVYEDVAWRFFAIPAS